MLPALAPSPPAPSLEQTFRAPGRLVIRSIVFCIGSAGVTAMAGVGISATEGFQQLLLGITTVFPFLVTLATGLQLVSVASRRITVSATHLLHHQLWKHYEVPLTSIKYLETLHDEEDRVVTLRVRWGGTPFYIDSFGVDDFDSFLALLRSRVPSQLCTRVEGFEPVT